jgi:hypothetical protein
MSLSGLKGMTQTGIRSLPYSRGCERVRGRAETPTPDDT